MTVDVISHFFNWESCDIHLNHGDLLEAIWSWTGVKPQNRQKVAEVRFRVLQFSNNDSTIVHLYVVSMISAALTFGFIASSIFRKEIKMGVDQAPASTGQQALSQMIDFALSYPSLFRKFAAIIVVYLLISVFRFRFSISM